MSKPFPSPDEVRQALEPLSVAGLQELASASRIPFHTLLKIRDGTTKNPRLGTVRQFWPHVPKLRATPAEAAA